MNVNVPTPAIIASDKAVPFEVEQVGRHFGARNSWPRSQAGVEPAHLRKAARSADRAQGDLLRDQNLTTAEHVEISRMFGELEVHPFRPKGEFPEIMVLDNHKDNPVLSTDVWHSDTTFRVRPTKYTILRCQIMPKTGGDTLWCDMNGCTKGWRPHARILIR